MVVDDSPSAARGRKHPLVAAVVELADVVGELEVHRLVGAHRAGADAEPARRRDRGALERAEREGIDEVRARWGRPGCWRRCRRPRGPASGRSTERRRNVVHGGGRLRPARRGVNCRSFLDFDRDGPYVAQRFPAAPEFDPMIELGEVVQSLAARDGVEAVLLLSGDGLPIEHAARGAFDSETVAALGRHTGPARRPARPGRGAGASCATAVLEYARRPAGAGARGQRTTGSRCSPPPTPTSVRCSSICASIARRWPRCSDALGRPPGRGLGHPLLAAQHAPTPRSSSSRSPAPAPPREEAVERLEGLIPRERVLVVAGDALAGAAADRCSSSRPRISWSSRARRRPRRR